MSQGTFLFHHKPLASSYENMDREKLAKHNVTFHLLAAVAKYLDSLLNEKMATLISSKPDWGNLPKPQNPINKI